MSNGAKVALAVGAGYLLGRTRKGRLALMLAGAGLTGKFPARATDVVAHGLKSLGTSEQVGNLADQLRGELLGAAKAAALAAATNRVDALNDRIQGIASPSAATDVADRAAEPVRSVSGVRRMRSSDEGEDTYDEEYEDEAAGDEDEYEDAEVVDDIDEEETSEPEAEPDERPRSRARRRASRQDTAPRSARRRSATTTRRAPVRRGR